MACIIVTRFGPVGLAGINLWGNWYFFRRYNLYWNKVVNKYVLFCGYSVKSFKTDSYTEDINEQRKSHFGILV